MTRELVTVVVPARDEEGDIAGCVEAVAAQDYGSDRIQLIVVDGASADRTVDVVLATAWAGGFDEVLVLANPDRLTSAALNIGLSRARGAYLVRVDARSRIPPGYVSGCVSALAARPEVGVVGGSQVAVARSGRLVDRAIAAALRNRWATGLSRYRRSSVSGPGDTVWMGCFRTAEVRDLGGWDEAVRLNEDYELNARYRASGRTVWFDAGLRSGYLPRRSVGALARQYFAFGKVKGAGWAGGRAPAPRQLALVGLPVVAGAATRACVRRFGSAAFLLVPAALVAVERGGRRLPEGEAPAPAPAAAAAIAVVCGAWWSGVVAGLVGQLVCARRSGSAYHRARPPSR